MTRETPKLVLAWTDGVKPKRYISPRAAYYAIAKALVVAKYPPIIGGWDDGDATILGPGWTNELVERRRAKMFDLFYTEAEEGYFCSRRWTRFINRVARFLAFVDRKRTPAELLELRFGGFLPAESAALAQVEYESCERASVQFAERARELRRYIDAIGASR